MSGFDEDPQLEVVGHREGDWLIWDDGRPPTLLPEDLRSEPADPVCQSEDEP